MTRALPLFNSLDDVLDPIEQLRSVFALSNAKSYEYDAFLKDVQLWPVPYQRTVASGFAHHARTFAGMSRELGVRESALTHMVRVALRTHAINRTDITRDTLPVDALLLLTAVMHDDAEEAAGLLCDMRPGTSPASARDDAVQETASYARKSLQDIARQHNTTVTDLFPGLNALDRVTNLIDMATSGKRSRAALGAVYPHYIFEHMFNPHKWSEIDLYFTGAWKPVDVILVNLNEVVPNTKKLQDISEIPYLQKMYDKLRLRSWASRDRNEVQKALRIMLDDAVGEFMHKKEEAGEPLRESKEKTGWPACLYGPRKMNEYLFKAICVIKAATDATMEKYLLPKNKTDPLEIAKQRRNNAITYGLNELEEEAHRIRLWQLVFGSFSTHGVHQGADHDPIYLYERDDEALPEYLSNPNNIHFQKMSRKGIGRYHGTFVRATKLDMDHDGARNKYTNRLALQDAGVYEHVALTAVEEWQIALCGGVPPGDAPIKTVPSNFYQKLVRLIPRR